MTDDELYVGYLIDQRIQRRTKEPNKLHQIYSTKYANWIIPYLRKHGIMAAPPLVLCNTLYRLPDYFGFDNKFFFLFDYYLYDYIYDMNFALDRIENNEYMYNLWIKIYIENLFMQNDLDTCYKFCITSSTLEEYKYDEKYKDKNLMCKIVDLSDIQEAVILLHEASHYLCEYYGVKVKSSRNYIEISRSLFHFLEENKYSIPVLKMRKDLSFDINDLLEECYCDAESVHFVLKLLFWKEEIKKEDLFIQIFRTILSIYFLHFIMTSGGVDNQVYTDVHMKQLTYRLGNMYSTIVSFLIENDKMKYKTLLDQIYEQQLQEFIFWSRNLRKFIGIARHEMDGFVAETEENMKYEVIKDFLVLT